MKTLALPPIDVLESWFELLPEDRPELLAPSRYLILGGEFAELLRLEPPDPEAVAEVLRLLRDLAPEAFDCGRQLAEESPPGRRALLELAVDALVDCRGAWHHPSQVLDRPRPAYRELLPVCLERLRRAPDSEQPHVEEVTAKVQAAARISEEARQRRRRLRGS